MKQITLTFLFIIVIFSCTKKSNTNLIITGEIQGLEEGTLYLQKKKDTTLITVDSIQLTKKNTFTLSDNIKSPEIYFLTYKDRTSTKKMMFFAEKGTIHIKDNLKNFGWKPKITGSKNHDLYVKFKKIDDSYKYKRLNFIAMDIEARAKKDSTAIDSLLKAYTKMKIRRFSTTIQFALNNKDYEVAPYLAMSALFDANFSYIDSINNNLSLKVKASKYGQQLQEYIDDVKLNRK